MFSRPEYRLTKDHFPSYPAHLKNCPAPGARMVSRRQVIFGLGLGPAAETLPLWAGPGAGSEGSAVSESLSERNVTLALTKTPTLISAAVPPPEMSYSLGTRPPAPATPPLGPKFSNGGGVGGRGVRGSGFTLSQKSRNGDGDRGNG